MKKNLLFTTILSFVLFIPLAHAQVEERYVYGGASSEENENTGNTPFAIGMLWAKNSSIYGGDIAREGSYLDTTGANLNPGGNRFPAKWKNAYSINGLYGAKLNKSGNFQVYAMGLLGIRQSSRDCSAGLDGSFHGYDCFADTDAEQEYDLNFGGMLMIDMAGITIGARVTGESTMGILGFRF